MLILLEQSTAKGKFRSSQTRHNIILEYLNMSNIQQFVTNVFIFNVQAILLLKLKPKHSWPKLSVWALNKMEHEEKAEEYTEVKAH